MEKIKLIILREYLSRVSKKSFLVMSLLGPILMAGIVIFSLWLGAKESEHQRILVVDDNYPLFTSLPSSEHISYEFTESGLDKALQRLELPEFTAVMYIPKNVLSSGIGEFYFKKQPSIRTQRQIEQGIQQFIEIEKLKLFQISETDYRRLKSPFSLNTFKFEPGSQSAEKVDYLPAIVGLVLSIIIYMFIFMYSVQVMRGVIEEKTNRIIEVMVSSVRPFELMLGKIVGVGAVGLTQFVIWVILTFAIITVGQAVILDAGYSSSNVVEQQMTDQVRKEMSEANDLPLAKMSDEDNLFVQLSRVNFPLLLTLFLFYFLGGYFLYSAMMAAAGSAVDNDTDTQQFVLPITSPLIFSYIVSFSVFENPSGALAEWLSIIPFTSPVIMMIRASMNAATIQEISMSMFLLILTFLLMVWLAARVFRTGILMYGKKAGLREILKWIRHA